MWLLLVLWLLMTSFLLFWLSVLELEGIENENALVVFCLRTSPCWKENIEMFSREGA